MNMVEPRNFDGLRGKLALDAPLAKHTSWRAGGRADATYVPADRDDLAAFLRRLNVFEPVTVLGLGSNVLIRDGGVRGVVVLLHNPGGVLAVSDGLVYAEAASPARSWRGSRRCTAAPAPNSWPACPARSAVHWQ